MTTQGVLRLARDKITPEGAWTQGVMARDQYDESVRPDDPRAKCWCADGALYVNDGLSESVRQAHVALTECISGKSTSYFNDTHTHAEVLALFDKAIAKLEAA